MLNCQRLKQVHKFCQISTKILTSKLLAICVKVEKIRKFSIILAVCLSAHLVSFIFCSDAKTQFLPALSFVFIKIANQAHNGFPKCGEFLLPNLHYIISFCQRRDFRRNSHEMKIDHVNRMYLFNYCGIIKYNYCNSRSSVSIDMNALCEFFPQNTITSLF
ncbi:hypothetical protein EGR_08331 [Echinococcus granulosus]|uniref:Uncharacterized protein n=1 Tax=Echinococcus granulosus TaxID=6210 RepID=W6UF80_ECHGR|nr:hypothetical protein EGR_08331 [Echinococcus granulosus]EUB56807.1 hypothetical protein EGR_08331 [Echinococcus granulosus]